MRLIDKFLFLHPVFLDEITANPLLTELINATIEDEKCQKNATWLRHNHVINELFCVKINVNIQKLWLSSRKNKLEIEFFE